MKRISLNHHALIKNYGFLVLFAVFTILSGCATGQISSSGGTAADMLPRPGATVEMGKITMQSQHQLDFDPANLLNEALLRNLKEEQLLWLGDMATPRFLFDASIVDYEPGNAFKRWVLPGWGSTVLEVKGELRMSDNRAVAAVIENKRSIYAGGLYTIGAWKGIIDDVASIMVREMKERINGGGFVVSLNPYSEENLEVAQSKHPLEIDVRRIRDQRTDKLRLGERSAAFGVKMGNVYSNRKPGEYLTETLSDALRTMGHKVGPSAKNLTVDGEILKFWVVTPATMLYWDVNAELELKLQIKGNEQEAGKNRVYISQKKERTYVWPSATLIEKAVRAAVFDVMRQIQSDDVWNSLVSGDNPGNAGITAR